MTEYHECPICADEPLVPFLSAMSTCVKMSCLRCGHEATGVSVPMTGVVVMISRRPNQIESFRDADGERIYFC